MKIAGEYLLEGPRDVVWEALMDPDVLCSVLPGCEKLERVGEDEYEGALEIKIGPVQGAFRGKVKLSDIVKPDSYTMRVDGQGASGFVNATGHMKLRSEDGNDGQTHVDYEGDAQVGGRLAAVGQRLVESSAKAIIKQSLDGLNEAVKARAASGMGGASAAGGGGGDAFAADASAEAPADAAGAVGPGGGSNWDPNAPAGEAGAASGSATEAPAAPAAPAAPTPTPAAPKRPSQAEFAANVARDVAADMIPGSVRWGLGIAALAAVLYFIYAVFM